MYILSLEVFNSVTEFGTLGLYLPVAPYIIWDISNPIGDAFNIPPFLIIIYYTLLLLRI